MKYYVINNMQKASQEVRDIFKTFINKLETRGHKIYLPCLDTNQNATGLEINTQDKDAIMAADEILIFRDNSIESHFDLGMIFMLNKSITIMNYSPLGDEKSFEKMLHEWIRSRAFKKYPVWMEGYSVTGQSQSAIFVGYGYGNTFVEAAKDALKKAKYTDIDKYFDEKTTSWWGCGLFDNESEARRNFG